MYSLNVPNALSSPNCNSLKLDPLLGLGTCYAEFRLLLLRDIKLPK